MSLNTRLVLCASEGNYFCVVAAWGRSKIDKPADNVTKTTRSTTAHFESYKSFEQNTMNGYPYGTQTKLRGWGYGGGQT